MVTRVKARTIALSLGIVVGLISSSASGQAIKLMGWVGLFDFQKPGWERIVEEFEKQNPGVTIEYIGTPFEETLNQATVAIVGGNAPDIIQISSGWVPQLQAMDALEPLDNHFSADVLGKFPKSLIEATTIEGHVYSLPWIPGPIIMAYNRNLLKEAGLDPDNPPKTWPELTDAIDKVCALPDRSGGKVYGAALRTSRGPNTAHWAIPVIWGLGGEIVDADGNIDVTNEGIVRAYEWYRDIVSSGCSPDAFNIQEVRNLFAQERAGFIFEGPWVRGLVTNLSDGKLSVALDGDVWIAPMPAGPDGRVRQIANSNELVITASSENKELAAKFVDFVLGNPETVEYYFETSKQLTTGRLDVLSSGAMGDDPFVQAFVEVLPVSNGVPIKHPKWFAVMDAMAPTLQKVIKGADASAELQQTKREVDRILSR